MAKKLPKRDPKKLSIDVVEARAIVLVDEFGIERATLSCTGGESGRRAMTVLQINDDDGRPRLELQVDPNGNPSIRLATPNDAAGISLAVSNHSGNGISVGDSEGRACITLSVPHPGSNYPPGSHPEIRILDESTGRQWSTSDGECIVPRQVQNEVTKKAT